jgi:hypothetical protein
MGQLCGDHPRDPDTFATTFEKPIMLVLRRCELRFAAVAIR